MSESLNTVLYLLTGLGGLSVVVGLFATARIFRMQAAARTHLAAAMRGADSLEHEGAGRVVVTIQYRDGSQQVIVDREAPEDPHAQEVVEAALLRVKSA